MILKQKIGSFRYVPHYAGNRALPDAERMSFLLRPVTRLELVAQAQWANADELTAWRGKALAEHLKHEEYGALIPQLPAQFQVGLRQFIEHVSMPQNVQMEDEDGTTRTLTDPVEIYLEMAGEDWDVGMVKADGGFASLEEAAEFGLIAEIQYVLNTSATLRGDERKNFLSLCAGSSQPTATVAAPAPEADAPDKALT